jgi:hypothetical protein
MRPSHKVVRIVRSLLAGVLGGSILLLLSSGCVVATTHYDCEGKNDCELRVQDTCEIGDGCTWDSSCQKVGCENHVAQIVCESFSFCVWTSTGTCSDNGGPSPCNLAQADCEANSSCRWASACAGAAVGCGQRTAQSACEKSPGCRWTAEPGF